MFLEDSFSFCGLHSKRAFQRDVPVIFKAFFGWIRTYIISGWWFWTFFIFPYIGNNPNWLSYFSEEFYMYPYPRYIWLVASNSAPNFQPYSGSQSPGWCPGSHMFARGVFMGQHPGIAGLYWIPCHFFRKNISFSGRGHRVVDSPPNMSLVGGFIHFLFSIIYGIILPID